MKPLKRWLLGIGAAGLISMGYLLTKPMRPTEQPNAIQAYPSRTIIAPRSASRPANHGALQKQDHFPRERVTLAPFAALEGVVTEDGRGVKDARVHVAPAYLLGDDHKCLESRLKTTNERGEFSVPVFPGLYDVFVLSADNNFGMQRNISVPGHKVFFSLESRLNLDLVAEGLTNERVALTMTYPALDVKIPGLEKRNNHYRCSNLPDGVYLVDIATNNRRLFQFIAMTKHPLEEKRLIDGDLQLHVNARGLFSPVPTTLVNGKVVDEQTQEPIANAHLTLTHILNPSLRDELVTGSDGVFALKTITGKHQVEISAQNYIPATHVVETSAAQNLIFPLSIGATVMGRLINLGLQPLPDWGVSMLDANGSVGGSRAAVTDNDGLFQFSGYKPSSESLETAVLLAHGTTAFRKNARLEKLDGNAAAYSLGDLVVDFQPCTLKGLVVADGAPVAGAQILLDLENSTPELRRATRYGVVSDQYGRFEFPSLAPEKYVLTALAKGFPEHQESCAISSDQELRILLEKGYALHGIVVDGNGYGLGNTSLVFDGPQRGIRTVTDASGVFSVSPMKKGAYQYFAFNDPREQHGDVVIAGDVHPARLTIQFPHVPMYQAAVRDKETGAPIPFYTVHCLYRTKENGPLHARERKILDVAGMLHYPLGGQFHALSITSDGYRRAQLSYDPDKERQPDVFLEREK